MGDAMKKKNVTPRWILEKVSQVLEMELPSDAIILLSKSKKSLTVTLAKKKAIVKRWRIHVVEET